MLQKPERRILVAFSLFAVLLMVHTGIGVGDELERGFRNPPRDARPHAYWLWLNGYLDEATARAELQAMKSAGIGGVLVFDMGARGDRSVQPPAGPAFLSPRWLTQFKESLDQAKRLALQVDLSVVSSWDLGGPWVEPKFASMGLYSTETTLSGGKALEVTLPFPAVPDGAPKSADGRPIYWQDIAVLGIHNAHRQPGHQFVFKLDPQGEHLLREIILDNGSLHPPDILAPSMTPTRDFSVAVSGTGYREKDFSEVVRGTLRATAGPQRFSLPAGTRARYVQLRLLSGHDPSRPRWTLGEFEVFDSNGTNLVAARAADRRRTGASLLRGSPALGYDSEWNLENLHDGETDGAAGVFASAGLPPLALDSLDDVTDITVLVDRQSRLRWNAPPGSWTILRYVCLNTGERLKVPSPASDGWATDHLNPEATQAHMDYVIARLRESLGDLAGSGLSNLYLASYEVRGPIWSPGFADEFERHRGYSMIRWLPALFGGQVTNDELTGRFLFDYRKTLGEVLIDAYYRVAREAAHAAGLTIKSEAGGPGPPVHNVPVDALLANSAVDEIQGEFWPYEPDADAMWVVKETAAAGHIYDRPRVHMEAFTSFEEWREGPQDLKPSADRVFCEGGNHMVWHTWSHGPPEAGKPGWAYLAGTHINRNVTWWPKVRPFLDYLARSSYLLQQGQFVADVLYYYGDGGYRFVGPRRNEPALGPGYDYDVANSDVILNRLSVRNGRLMLPDGTSYAVLVLPSGEDAHPDVLEKIEQLVAAGATVIGPRPIRAVGLEGYPGSDRRVREIASRLWGEIDGTAVQERRYGEGRIIQGIPLRDVLSGMGIPPDFTAPDALDYIHRKVGAADIYFVRNRSSDSVHADVSFRVRQLQPEFWNPVNGEIAPATAYRAVGSRVEVPVTLAPFGSVFVVFRRPATPDAISWVSNGAEVVVRDGKTVLQAEQDGEYEVVTAGGKRKAIRIAGIAPRVTLDGEWVVEFQQGLGAPERIRIAALKSWTQHPAPAVRFFSGTARYRKAFSIPDGWRRTHQRVRLDLGRLWTIGEAWLNGKSLGILWTAPFRVDCTEALRDGSNELVVEVTNTWYNRLIGDSRLPPEKRITRTNVQTSGGRPWADLEPVESGLMGPVQLIPLGEQNW